MARAFAVPLLLSWQGRCSTPCAEASQHRASLPRLLRRGEAATNIPHDGSGSFHGRWYAAAQEEARSEEVVGIGRSPTLWAIGAAGVLADMTEEPIAKHRDSEVLAPEPNREEKRLDVMAVSHQHPEGDHTGNGWISEVVGRIKRRRAVTTTTTETTRTTTTLPTTTVTSTFVAVTSTVSSRMVANLTVKFKRKAFSPIPVVQSGHMPVSHPLRDAEEQIMVINGTIILNGQNLDWMVDNPLVLASCKMGIANALTWSADAVTITSLAKTSPKSDAQASVGYKIMLQGALGDASAPLVQRRLRKHFRKQFEAAMSSMGQATSLKSITAKRPEVTMVKVGGNGTQLTYGNKSGTADEAPKTNAKEAFHIGELVKVRDADDAPWLYGNVTSVAPLEVLVHGWEQPFGWNIIKKAQIRQRRRRGAARRQRIRSKGSRVIPARRRAVDTFMPTTAPTPSPTPIPTEAPVPNEEELHGDGEERADDEDGDDDYYHDKGPVDKDDGEH